jgi:hypothetical protein
MSRSTSIPSVTYLVFSNIGSLAMATNYIMYCNYLLLLIPPLPFIFF